MATHELFLTGIQLNLKLDRDTEFSLSITSQQDEELSEPIIEIERSRVPGKLIVPPALIPVPTIGFTNKTATGLFTEAMTGGMNDLAPDGRIFIARYRFRAKADDGPTRTYLAGILAIGPVGYAMSSENLDMPFVINTGDIIIGTTVIDPGDPPPDDEAITDVVYFDSSFHEVWDADHHVTWEASA